jgi:RNA polymerase sigma-70 factor (ECF subfamily)
MTRPGSIRIVPKPRQRRSAVALSVGHGYPGVTRERRQPLEFFTFDRDYLQRLAQSEAETEHHFVDYFSSLLLVKLRNRLPSREALEDLRQEVFLRVLRSLRTGPGLERPECLGAYVNSVCNNVILEHFRDRGRAEQWDETAPEPRDPATGVESRLVSEERRKQLRAVIDEMPAKDRSLIRAIFLDEQDKDAVCQEHGVERNYLRVLLHRAKKRLRQRIEQAKTLAARGCNGPD